MFSRMRNSKTVRNGMPGDYIKHSEMSLYEHCKRWSGIQYGGAASLNHWSNCRDISSKRGGLLSIGLLQVCLHGGLCFTGCWIVISEIIG